MKQSSIDECQTELNLLLEKLILKKSEAQEDNMNNNKSKNPYKKIKIEKEF